MVEYNIYSGTKGHLKYQETEFFENLLDAELYAQEVSEMDAEAFHYPKDKCVWLAIETNKDNIPYDARVGCDYM